MVIEHPLLEMGPWLLRGLPIVGILVVLFAMLGLITAFVVSVQRNGPALAIRSVARDVAQSWRDLMDFSLRRCLAIARLSIKEAIRSYVLIVVVVFAIVLLFAGWFFSDEMDHPTRWYISFVVKLAGFLSILMAIFLSAFSLPNDMKNKTIFTVVTKPVRAWEIVFGRILGFAAIGTVLLAAMGLMGYVWVIRAVAHRHVVTADAVQWDAETQLLKGKTTLSKGHRHEFAIPKSGGQSFDIKGHYHELTVTGDDQNRRVAVGPARGALQAQVPVYVPPQGGLRFLDRSGKLAARGINVGKEWEYRGYIEGGTQCAAIFWFRGLASRDFPTSLPLEMSIRVFRTYKGVIDRGIRGSIVLRNPAMYDPKTWEQAKRDNPDLARESEPISFFASDLSRESRDLPRTILARMADDSVREIDIFESLVHNGELEVVIQCDERGQYFGMAFTDLYLRAADGYFTLNFLKTCFTLWLRMWIVLALGVMFSTFLAGPVAMLATIATIVLGFFAQAIANVSSGETQGGGPIESLIRNIRQDNLVSDLGFVPLLTNLIKTMDHVVMLGLRAISAFMPNLGDYAERGGVETTRFVAYGFDIPRDLLLQHTLIALAYLIFCTCAGYYLLKSKEVAA